MLVSSYLENGTVRQMKLNSMCSDKGLQESSRRYHVLANSDVHGLASGHGPKPGLNRPGPARPKSRPSEGFGLV